MNIFKKSHTKSSRIASLAVLSIAIAALVVALSPASSVLAHEALPEHFHFAQSSPAQSLVDWFNDTIDTVVSFVQNLFSN